MKKTFIYLFSLFFIFQSSVLSYSTNPKEFINELVNDAINKLADNNLTLDQKSSFVEEIALENVDINGLGLYTLGELRKSSSEKDISNFQKSFKKYFLKTLTSRLTEYSSSKLEIVSEEKKSTNYTIISSKIIPSNGDPEIKVDWNYTKNPSKPLIRDLIVEGLSLARTQKEVFVNFKL